MPNAERNIESTRRQWSRMQADAHDALQLVRAGDALAARHHARRATHHGAALLADVTWARRVDRAVFCGALALLHTDADFPGWHPAPVRRYARDAAHHARLAGIGV